MEDIRPYADDNERDDASENPVESVSFAFSS